MKESLLAIISFLCLVFFAKAQQAPATLTLKTAIDLAIRNNPEARTGEVLTEAAQVRKSQARYDLLPSINGNMSHGMNQGRSIDPFTNSYINQKVNFGNYSVGSSLLLFNGLQLQHNLAQNRFAYEASKFEWQQVKDNITLNVILVYLQILSAEEQLNASRNQVAVSRKQVERLEILNKEGAIAPALLYDLQGQLANDELAVVDNQNRHSSAMLLLAQLMNLPYSKDLKVQPLPAEEFIYDQSLSAESIYSTALAQLAIVKAADLRKAAAIQGVKLARSGFFPSVGLNGNIYTNYSSAASTDLLINSIEKPSADFVDIGGSKYPVIRQQQTFKTEKISYSNQFNNNYSSSVSIGIRVPILNAFRTKNQVALARLDLKNTTYIAENRRIALKQDIEQAHFNITAAYERYGILTRQVKNFTESFRAAEVRFNAGASTQVDYLIAKNNLDRANINLITARYDYMLRLKLIDFYLGRLNPWN